MKGNEEINKLEHEFLASSKVVRYKLGHKAADILCVLRYKFEYWKSEGKLVVKNGVPCFFISYSDIREETTFGESIIYKNIAILKKAGLIKTFRQGLGKPNLYNLDVGVIKKYITKYSKEYDGWRKMIRAESNKTTVNSMSSQKSTSTNHKLKVLDSSENEATNNKSTNNRNTKNKNENKNTNHINVAEYSEYSDCYYSIELEELLFAGMISDEDELEKSVESIYYYLRDFVPQFSGFKPSNKDLSLIYELLDFKMYPYRIAEKIISNAKRIMVDKMQSRFGNLFVGLTEINKEIEEKYHS